MQLDNLLGEMGEIEGEDTDSLYQDDQEDEEEIKI